MSVLVTGASGYVALHTIGQLLSDNYSVIGTLRSQHDIDKLTQKFKHKYPNTHDQLNLQFVVIPDIATPNAFDQLFQTHQSIKWVFHIASPTPATFNKTTSWTQDELKSAYLKPAVDGTIGILKSIHQHAPQVETVVLTSSVGAIQHSDDPNFIHTEQTWNPIEWDDHITDKSSAYMASKKFAEQAAWEYIKNNNDVKFTLNTINPPFIFGPQFFDEDVLNPNINTSANFITDLLKTDPSDTHLFDEIAHASIDVRDVAKIEVLAVSSQNIRGERLLVSSESWSLQEILNIINENFKQLQGKIAKGKPEGVKSIVNPFIIDNSKTVKLLGGYKFKSLKEQVIDTIDQVLKVNS